MLHMHFRRLLGDLRQLGIQQRQASLQQRAINQDQKPQNKEEIPQSKSEETYEDLSHWYRWIVEINGRESTPVAAKEDLRNVIACVDGGRSMAIGRYLARELVKGKRWYLNQVWYSGQNISGKWFQMKTTRYHSLMDTLQEGGMRIPLYRVGILHALFPPNICASSWIYRVWIDGGGVSCMLFDWSELT